MTCGPWPRPVKWWGRHWCCIWEPFSIVAQNLLTCALKLERASKCKHSETYECVSQCKTQSKLATSMAPLKTCFICDKLGGNVAKSSILSRQITASGKWQHGFRTRGCSQSNHWGKWQPWMLDIRVSVWQLWQTQIQMLNMYSTKNKPEVG